MPLWQRKVAAARGIGRCKDGARIGEDDDVAGRFAVDVPRVDTVRKDARGCDVGVVGFDGDVAESRESQTAKDRSIRLSLTRVQRGRSRKLLFGRAGMFSPVREYSEFIRGIHSFIFRVHRSCSQITSLFFGEGRMSGINPPLTSGGMVRSSSQRLISE